MSHNLILLQYHTRELLVVLKLHLRENFTLNKLHSIDNFTRRTIHIWYIQVFCDRERVASYHFVKKRTNVYTYHKYAYSKRTNT